MMLKVAFYARYSSDLQKPQSIEDQFLLCHQLAAREGWDVVRSYCDEAMSGASIRGRSGMRDLLRDAASGLFDIVCAEALDRIARDQEDMAHVYKALRFREIVLHTVAEGLADEMHIGFKGTMNALFLKDLADKTRRGQRGRIEKGRAGGGLAYGYDVVSDDEAGAGGRRINEREATVIRRIFRWFAEGETPTAIADALNREGVPGPGGRPWGATTIRGHRVRGTGILNNALYHGELIWNRQRFIKNPATGKRQARLNPEAEWVRVDVPDLRIIEERLWQTARSCQRAIERRHQAIRDGVRSSRETRACGLIETAGSDLHQLLMCAQCGGDFCHVGRDRYGCAQHYRRKICENGKTLQRRIMEGAIRDVLVETSALIVRHQSELIDEGPENAAVQRRQMERDRLQLERIDQRIGGLLSAIEDGLYTATLKVRFQQLEDQAGKLRARLQVSGKMLAVSRERSDPRRDQVQALIARLQENCTEYEVLQFKRTVGAIKVIPTTGRTPCRLSPTWQSVDRKRA